MNYELLWGLWHATCNKESGKLNEVSWDPAANLFSERGLPLCLKTFRAFLQLSFRIKPGWNQPGFPTFKPHSLKNHFKLEQFIQFALMANHLREKSAKMNNPHGRRLQNDKIRQPRYDKICVMRIANWSQWRNVVQIDRVSDIFC